MEKEKLKEILQSMDGITYLEWKKLKSCIDQCFSAEASKQNNQIQLAGIEQVIREYQHYSSTI